MHADFSTMTAPTLIVAGDHDQGRLTVRGPDWWRDVSPVTRRARRRTNGPSLSPRSSVFQPPSSAARSRRSRIFGYGRGAGSQCCVRRQRRDEV